MESRICVVGQGYVGLPLAILFDEVGHDVVGYDVDQAKVDQLANGVDTTGDVGDQRIRDADVEFTTDETTIERANYVLVTVPTPVDEMQTPNLEYVESAGETIGRNLGEETTVVLESTVYPGATWEILVPAVERTSGLTAGEGFFVGYSPERIVPGDDDHGFGDIVKIVSGQTEEVRADLSTLYETIVEEGVHQASSIEVAESAKCLENIQRDLNIALVNEMAVVCGNLGIETHDVLEAARTKWNFHDYQPGLVGGHCIPVDPFFVIYQSKRNGYLPTLVEEGRKVNEYVPDFVGKQTVKELNNAGKRPLESIVLVLGLTYKPNVSDIRTSAVGGMIETLESFSISVVGYDPHVDLEAAREEFDIPMQEEVSFNGIDAVVLATPHDELVSIDYAGVTPDMAPDPLLVDVMGVLDAERLRENPQLTYERL